MNELKLRIHTEGQAARTVRVNQDSFLIGRLHDCDLCLPFSEVSRYHTRITRVGDEWLVEDMESTNGTLLNQFRLTEPQSLRQGDVIQVGNAFLAVSLSQPVPIRITRIDGEGVSDVKTILRNAEELQHQWMEAEEVGDPLTTHQTAIARLKDLVEIAKKLNSAESIEAIFRQVKEVAFREIVNLQRVALLIDVDANGELELMNAAARDFPDDHPLVKDNTWISKTVCYRVFREKVSIKSVDAQSDERFEGEQSILAKGIRGVLAAPLWDQSEVVGVLYADAYMRLHDAKALEDDDLSFFSTLANLVASSVQRWLLNRKLQGEEQLRQKLERYHSPAVVQQLIAVGALENGRLRPVEADLSVLFADLVGFTALSETKSPSQIADLLNRFFEEMLKSVFASGGTLDKYIGDCIMAFFGAPEPQPDHPDRAVAAALGMLECLEKLNQAKVWNPPLELRIAINSGKAVVGDVGGSQRVDYTVLGGTVNLASRMEAICPPGECVISEVTYKRLRDRTPFISMGEGRFKGIDRAIRVYRTTRRTPAKEKEIINPE